MLILDSPQGEALSPALLRQIGGRWRVASFLRYRRALPSMLVLHTAALACALYAIKQRGDRMMLAAFGLFMLAFALRQLCAGGIVVNVATAPILRRAPIAVQLDAAMATATLALLGYGYLTLPALLDTPLLRGAGIGMLALALGRGVLLFAAGRR